MKDRIRELLEKIIIKAYEVNENTRFDIVLDFSGPSKSLIVHYYPEGYEQNDENLLELGRAYFDFTDGIEKLEDILEKLKELEEK